MGGEIAILHFQIDASAKDLSQLLPWWWSGDLNGPALVTPGDPDLARAHSEHEIEGTDGLLVAG